MREERWKGEKFDSVVVGRIHLIDSKRMRGTNVVMERSGNTRTTPPMALVRRRHDLLEMISIVVSVFFFGQCWEQFVREKWHASSGPLSIDRTTVDCHRGRFFPLMFLSKNNSYFYESRNTKAT